MQELTRRGFLRLAGAAALAVTLPLYREVPQLVVPKPFNQRDWIEDQGDFYVVRVPEGRTMTREQLLDKPVVFFMGARSALEAVEAATAIVYAPLHARLTDCVFSSASQRFDKERAVLTIAGKSNVELVEPRIKLGMDTPVALDLRENSTITVPGDLTLDFHDKATYQWERLFSNRIEGSHLTLNFGTARLTRGEVVNIQSGHAPASVRGVKKPTPYWEKFRPSFRSKLNVR
jgi:hypothetical protein